MCLLKKQIFDVSESFSRISESPVTDLAKIYVFLPKRITDKKFFFLLKTAKVPWLHGFPGMI